MWFRRNQKKPIIYQLAALLAILAVVGILITGTNVLQKQRELRAEREAAAARLEAQKQQTLLQAERVNRYQKYCEPTVLRIDTGGDMFRIVRNAKDAILYERAGKKFTCPNDSNPDCALVLEISFEGAYTCPVDPMIAVRSGENALVMNTQPAGTAVVIDRVVLAAQGFVRIESNATAPVSISHSALLPAGVLEYVSIAIPTPLIGGMKYRATLYQDNGDGELTEADSPIMNDAGQPLTAIFDVKRR